MNLVDRAAINHLSGTSAEYISGFQEGADAVRSELFAEIEENPDTVVFELRFLGRSWIKVTASDIRDWLEELFGRRGGQA